MCSDEVGLCEYISNPSSLVIKMIEMAYVITQIEIEFEERLVKVWGFIEDTSNFTSRLH